MKLIYAALGMVAMCAVGLGAQSSTTQTTTKIEVKDGKEVKVDGCLERNPGGGYVLTHSEVRFTYALITNKDLSKHVGQRVEVKGKAADQGEGKVKFESSVDTTGSKKTDLKSEIKGEDLAGMRYLGVKSVKRISGTCG